MASGHGRVRGLSVAAGLLTATVIAACTAAVADEAPQALGTSGTTQSGSSFELRITRPQDRGTCVELIVSRKDSARRRSKECLPTPAVGTYVGAYELDCETKDFFAFGLISSKSRNVRLLGSRGTVEARQTRVEGRTAVSAFVLAASGADLPGRILSVDRSGRMSRQRTSLSSRARACRPIDGEAPGLVFGSL